MRIGIALPNTVADLPPEVVPRWAATAPTRHEPGVHRYHAFLGGHAADITDGVLTSPHAIRATNDAFARIGADELFFMPGTTNSTTTDDSPTPYSDHPPRPTLATTRYIRKSLGTQHNQLGNRALNGMSAPSSSLERAR